MNSALLASRVAELDRECSELRSNYDRIQKKNDLMHDLLCQALVLLVEHGQRNSDVSAFIKHVRNTPEHATLLGSDGELLEVLSRALSGRLSGRDTRVLPADVKTDDEFVAWVRGIDTGLCEPT